MKINKCECTTDGKIMCMEGKYYKISEITNNKTIDICEWLLELDGDDSWTMMDTGYWINSTGVVRSEHGKRLNTDSKGRVNLYVGDETARKIYIKDLLQEYFN